MHKIFLLAILLVLNCFQSFAAAAAADPQPTTLFRAQKTSSAQAPQVYVLGSVHTKPVQTYPGCFLETVKEIANQKGHLFTEIEMQPTPQQVEETLRALSLTAEILDELRKSATLHEKDPEIIERWIDFFVNTLLPRIDAEPKMRFLLETNLMHPTILLSYGAAGFTSTIVDASSQGIDDYVSNLFAADHRTPLETYEQRAQLMTPPDELGNFLIFEQHAEELMKAYHQSASTGAPAEPDLAEEEDLRNKTDNFYELFCQNPLSILEDDGIAIQERNRLWCPQIQMFLRSQTTHPVLITVGAGHLGGEFGVLNFLTAQGYTIFQIHTDGSERPLIISPDSFKPLVTSSQ